MSERTGKHRKRYVDHPQGESKNCLIHFPGNSSDECKVMGDFGSKYVKSTPTKDRGNDTVPRNKFNIQQENNDIVNSAVDEILLNENQKLSAAKEAPEKIESNFDENELYQIYKRVLNILKKKLDDISVRLNTKFKIHMGLKIIII